VGALNNVQKSLDKIGAKYARIAAVWKKGIQMFMFLFLFFSDFK